MITLPTVGELYYYRPKVGKDATFRVVEVNRETGCIYLEPHYSDVLEVSQSLTHQTKGKGGRTIDVLAYAYIEKENRFAVNVEWDAWRLDTHKVEDVLSELTRISEELNLYEPGSYLPPDAKLPASFFDPDLLDE